MKKFIVYTYFWPEEKGNGKDLYLAYLRYDSPCPRMKAFEVEAENGTKAKAKAIQLRKAIEKGNDWRDYERSQNK